MINFLKKHSIWIIFIVAVCFQLGFPISSIIEKNDVLANGIEYKIKTQPIDPADPFRGRYVAIGVEVELAEHITAEQGYVQEGYLRLGEGDDGFAEVIELSTEPLKGEGVLKLNHVFIGETVSLPYDRYYMQEKVAPKAEAIYNREQEEAYVTIRVKNGVGAVSGLYVNEMRIEDYVKQFD